MDQGGRLEQSGRAGRSGCVTKSDIFRTLSKDCKNVNFHGLISLLKISLSCSKSSLICMVLIAESAWKSTSHLLGRGRGWRSLPFSWDWLCFKAPSRLMCVCICKKAGVSGFQSMEC